MEPKRIVIIGGGLAGLAASYDLARARHRVVLLEAAADFGGLAPSASRAIPSSGSTTSFAVATAI